MISCIVVRLATWKMPWLFYSTATVWPNDMAWLVIWLVFLRSMTVLSAKSLVLLLHVTWFIAISCQRHGDNFVHYSKFLAFHGGFSDHTWGQVESHDLMWDGESLGAKIKGHLDAPALWWTFPIASDLCCGTRDPWFPGRLKRGWEVRNGAGLSKKYRLFEWEANVGWFWWYSTS